MAPAIPYSAAAADVKVLLTSPYSDAQNRFLGITVSLVAVFSFLGSGMIVNVIIRERKILLRRTYHRIMFGLSICDVLAALGTIVFGPWAIPEDVPYVVGARASSRLPCDISGFFNQMYLASLLYTVALMIFFLISIRLEWRPQTIARRVEPLMHFFCISIPLSTGVYATAGGYMNPLDQVPGVCWIIEYPPGCSDDENQPCIREGNSLLSRSLGGGSLIIAFVVSFISTVLLTHKVYVTEQKMKRYDMGHVPRKLKRTKGTAVRGLQYVAAFSLFFPGFLIQFLDKDSTRSNRTVLFWFAFLYVTLTPLQGVLNAWIYFQPRLHEWRKAKAAEAAAAATQAAAPDLNDKLMNNDLDLNTGSTHSHGGSGTHRFRIVERSPSLRAVRQVVGALVHPTYNISSTYHPPSSYFEPEDETESSMIIASGSRKMDPDVQSLINDLELDLDEGFDENEEDEEEEEDDDGRVKENEECTDALQKDTADKKKEAENRTARSTDSGPNFNHEHEHEKPGHRRFLLAGFRRSRSFPSVLEATRIEKPSLVSRKTTK